MIHNANSIDSNPLVSVCAIAYKHEQFLPEMFESILAQTYRNIELIFVDDASPDKGWEIAKSYEARLRDAFPRVTLIQHDLNRGMNLTNLTATKAASGALRCNLDGDDYYMPTRIEECVQFFAQRPDYGAVHSDYFRIENGKRADQGFWQAKGKRPPEGWIFEPLMLGNFIIHSSLMARADLFQRCFQFAINVERGYLMNDYPAEMMMSKETKIGFIDNPLLAYRILEGSASRDSRNAYKFDHSKMLAQQDARLGIL